MTLDDLLADPVTRLVMRSDGVCEADVGRLMAEAASHLRLRFNAAKPDR